MRRLAAPLLAVFWLLAAATSAQGAGPALTLTKIQALGGGVSDLASGPGGIWFTALGSKQVGRISPAGKVARFALPIVAVDNSAAGNNIVLGPDGNIWVTGKTSSQSVLVRVKPSGKGSVVGLELPLAPGKDAVAALGTRKGGPLYFGVWWNRAGRIAATGTLLAGADEASGFPQTAAALGFAADRSGAVWFVYGRGYGRIVGTAVTTWEPSDGHKHEFRDIVLGPDGNMWVADNNNAERLGVGRIAADGKLTEYPVAGGPSSSRWAPTATSGSACRTRASPASRRAAG